MNKYRYIFLVLCLMLTVAGYAQKLKLEGTVIDSYTNQPLEGAVVSITGQENSVKTNKEGTFSAEMDDLYGEVSVWYPGFYVNVMPVAGRSKLHVVMIPETKFGYADKMLLPFKGATNIRDKQTALNAVQKSNLNLNKVDVDQSLVNIPGVQVINKGGMPGEGSYFNVRGVNSVLGTSNPLIVVNGVPYMPDTESSQTINGYSRSIFNLLNAQDIENITVLKGSDASLYGSLGSNGVILIETDKAVDLDTKVEFIGQYGIDWNSKTLPVLGVEDYKSYISNVALTKYDDMADVLSAFPYLIDDPSYYYNYKYNNNTDWQDLIYRKAFTTDNLLKIKGGDAIAKYDISLGVKNRGGVMDETSYSRYYARVNADVNLSKNVSLFSTVSMGYTNNKLQEQGLVEQTNPMLAAMKKAPIFSPYEKDANNNLLPDYATIRDEDGKVIENNSVTNPLTLFEYGQMKERTYDVLLNLGVKYKITNEINLQALAGLFYNLNRQDAFVPGKTYQSVMPLSDGLAQNSARSGEGTTLNYYFNVNANYAKVFNYVHDFHASAGVQVAINKNEYKGGSGYNSANDFYKTLQNMQEGRMYYGYNERWNWLNYNASVAYTYNHQVGAGVKVALDGSSMAGVDAPRYQAYPAVNAIWYVKNSVLKNINFIDKLNVRAEYAMTGNSRFSSVLSKYHYRNQVYRTLSGLTRDGIPNTSLKPERTKTFNAGLDVAVWNNRVDLSFDYYNGKSTDLILPVEISSVYGTSYIYKNIAEASNKGIELGLQVALIQNRDIRWYVGGTIAKNTNKLTSLGGASDLGMVSLADGATIISGKGMPVYSFYGYQTQGVFADDAAVVAAGKNGNKLTNAAGTQFSAGDVHFVDQNGDGKIDEDDRVNLGSADPKFFGNFYTTFQYKGFELSATFGYSNGNKMYNGLRRNMESMSDFTNQLSSVNKRWTTEGQVTDMPRAVYGDPMENSRFSDRYIEDASYLKLKELMISYRFNVMGGITVFAVGENLFTATKYLGLDPETQYSYDTMLRGFDYGKIANPRSVKLGVKLQF